MSVAEICVVEQKPVVRPGQRYLGAMFMSFGLTLLLVIGLLYCAQVTGTLPPLPLTASISFNEKALFVRGALHSRYDIVAAGSSMTLNNLSSDVLSEEMPDHPHVLNIGAWNMKIADTRRWLEDVLRYAHPRSVIVVTGLMDFYSEDPWFNITDKELDIFLSDSRLSRLFEFARNFSPEYYAVNWRDIRTMRLTRADYHSLVFDSGGAVPLEVYYPHINPERWNELPKVGMLSEDQYAQLDLLAKELRGRGIDLVFVQAPLRHRALVADLVELNKHWRRLDEILRQRGQRFIDLHDKLDFDDSYFADYSHLNAKGALVFTRELEHYLSGAQLGVFREPIANDFP